MRAPVFPDDDDDSFDAQDSIPGRVDDKRIHGIAVTTTVEEKLYRTLVLAFVETSDRVFIVTRASESLSVKTKTTKKKRILTRRIRVAGT